MKKTPIISIKTLGNMVPWYVSKDSKIKTKFGRDIVMRLPHGSGIDSDWIIEEKSDKVYAYNSYHCMDDNGFYNGWQDFYIIIPKKNPRKFKLHFQGNQYLARKYMLRGYLEDIIAFSLGV